MPVDDLCGAMVKQIHDEIEKETNRSLQSQGLTMAQINVLMRLNMAVDHALPLKELERLLHVAQSTAAGIVVRLEQKGFVKSRSDNDDRRVKIVEITEAGYACCINAEEYLIQTEQQFFSALTESERKSFHELLQKICESL